MCDKFDSEFSECVENKLEKCEDFFKSFEECLNKIYESKDIEKYLSCKGFLEFVKELMTREECISYHHYVIYYMARRCVNFSTEFRDIIKKVNDILDKNKADTGNMLDVINRIYELYVHKVIRSILRRRLEDEIEIAILCDILSRLQLYLNCISTSDSDHCRNILCSLSSRIHTLF